MPRGIVLCLLVSISLVLSLNLRGDIVISNLNGDDGTQSADLDDARNKGMGFTMPAGSDYGLENVVLRLDVLDVGMDPIVQIWDNSGSNLPGSPLITLVDPLFSSTGIANYTFTPSSPFTLQNTTTYWVVVYGAPGAPAFDWKADSAGITPTGVATHFGQFFDLDGPPPTDSSSVLNSYAVNGFLIPEPGSTVLIIGAGVALLMSRRVRKWR